MFKKAMLTALTLTALLCLLATTFVSAQEGTGNERKGKHLFRSTCRECHIENGSAAALSPDSKTQAQWERSFRPENVEELACKDEWAKQSEEDLEDIYTYLYAHAYDSPSPAKCK